MEVYSSKEGNIRCHSTIRLPGYQCTTRSQAIYFFFFLSCPLYPIHSTAVGDDHLNETSLHTWAGESNHLWSKSGQMVVVIDCFNLYGCRVQASRQHPFGPGDHFSLWKGYYFIYFPLHPSPLLPALRVDNYNYEWPLSQWSQADFPINQVNSLRMSCR